jgi:uncharacterized protein (DUF1778 family)
MQPLGAEDTRSERIELRVTPEEKALLLQAAEIAHLDMTGFVMRAALPAAQEVVERTEHDMLQTQQAVDDNSQNTGKDLIAFFRTSPLVDVPLELEHELDRDKATSRTLTF